MKDLSMHILDITENSVRAGARDVDVELCYKADALELTISDNGRGMDAEMVTGYRSLHHFQDKAESGSRASVSENECRANGWVCSG